MKSREEAAARIMKQMREDNKPGNCWHYGYWELRELMDYIYESKPKTKKEEILDVDLNPQQSSD